MRMRSNFRFPEKTFSAKSTQGFKPRPRECYSDS